MLLAENSRAVGCLIGVIVMLVALYFLWRSFHRQDRCTVSVKAVVVEVREEEVETVSEGVPISSTSYVPVFEFRLPNGRLVTAEGNFGSAAPGYEVGQTVDLLYNPENPREIDVPRDSRKITFIFIGLFALGAIGFVYSFFFLH